jgi:DNA-binding CsgD family transcriptional regulator
VEDGVVLTDLSLQPIAYDRGAAAILGCSSQQPGKPDAPVRLPPEVVEALGSHRAEDAFAVRTHFRRAGVTYTCCAYLLETSARQSAQPMMALLLQRDLCVDDAVNMAAAEYRLTEREQEVFRGILMGDTTKELAARLQRSPNTVKAFLRLIMIKMGVTTRAGLAGKLLNGDWRPS